jgi:putative nucleotidyltransferase with HDIG domain
MPMDTVGQNGQGNGPVDSFSLSEILSALSFALDLTEGAVPGHALRCCLLGMRIGEAAGLRPEQMESLYYALLLKDAGCSSNAARMCQIVGGDDRALKRGVKFEDWTKASLSSLPLLWKCVLPHSNSLRRALRIAKLALRKNQNNSEMIMLRCERGAGIVRKLGLNEATAEAVHCLDEHWDGSGHPSGLRGQKIPVLARICLVAQHLDVFGWERSEKEAIETLQKRSGGWFDPELVAIALRLHNEGTLWINCGNADDIDRTRNEVISLDPNPGKALSARHVDKICEAFADVVDAKSPFTYRHSVHVAATAVQIAQQMELAPERVETIRRAALLHDIGKLFISNTILDKPEKLTRAEFGIVREHPSLSREILVRVRAFEEIARVAGTHHERLDGSGYPDGLTARSLSLEDRLVAVADMYAALTEDRPYRDPMTPQEALDLLRSDTPHKLDAACVEALSVAVCSSVR